MISGRHARQILDSRLTLVQGVGLPARRTLEGGCGVIGIIGTDPLEGRSIIRSCAQMRNRGNGKGGGVAAAGLFGARASDYALHVAYLDGEVRAEIERDFVQASFDVAHAERQDSIDDHREVGLEVRPPEVWRYFVRARRPVLDAFAGRTGIDDAAAAEDELVFQNSFGLNRQYYASGRPRAFVLSHGRDLMILKGVGFAEQIASFYRLEDRRAHLWIGHQRYPTRGRVWHPGGAHPFAGLHEALVHNGDFANYHAVAEYLRQRGLVPLFVTDTEVSVLLFDLYVRVLGYPLELVIEALAPTPEGDFERLSKRRQRVYRAVQASHIHGSPDGPWFFIVARAEPGTGAPQLIGITDVSMLRPQVFALQEGESSYAAIASEKQAIDAFFEELSVARPGVSPAPDRVWNARGGSCTDGGAFVFSVRRSEAGRVLEVRDKFGALVSSAPQARTSLAPGGFSDRSIVRACPSGPERLGELTADRAPPSDEVRPRDPAQTGGRWEPGREGPAFTLHDLLCRGDFSGFRREAENLGRAKEPGAFRRALETLSLLRDRRWDPRGQRPAVLNAEVDRAIAALLDSVPGPGGDGEALRLDRASVLEGIPSPLAGHQTLVLDARGFPPEGRDAVCRAIVAGYRAGFRRFVVYRCHGDRFIGCGLGPESHGTRIDVYGSSGDYLGSGMDGAEIWVHGDAQDQVGQILNAGRIVVFGSVGQTFLYGAKGGEAFILGSAAGRPLINAVGRIRAVINGTCLDYCAESFMAGRELDGGFVIINGLGFDARGQVIGLELKYPGNNLFSLASGGACYLNDPYRTVGQPQLNGATFTAFRQADWNVIHPYLRTNEELFGISIRHDLLTVDGVLKWPKEVFRKVVASHEAGRLDWTSL